MLAEELEVAPVLAAFPELSKADLRQVLRQAAATAGRWKPPKSGAGEGTAGGERQPAGTRGDVSEASPRSPERQSAPARLDRRLVYTLHTDGASRGNPGPAGSGAVLFDPSGLVAHEHCRYLGRATNNIAEYQALLDGLEAALERGVARLEVRSDSELLCHQMNGIYRVKNAKLRPLYERAVKLAAKFRSFHIRHVRRWENSHADALANRAIDERAS
ncbi:MAG: ribonuclease HI family protein [Candidatus Tectomicrobia bacterium]|nr:ribonuclease HI family protein [Candidatus Tectomicrobia bacterium]